jgi:serine phosphatase RsbU (regulator of sigma subunit)/uncharacterized membrane protein/HAMP domain-containing protein
MVGSRIHFHVSILITFLGIVVALVLAVAASVHLISNDATERTATSLFDEITLRVRDQVSGQMDSVLGLTALAAARDGTAIEATKDGAQSPLVPFLMAALDANPALYSVYYGYDDGTYLQVVNVAGDRRIVQSLDAPAGTFRAVRAITGGAARHQTWTFLDAKGGWLGSAANDHPEYDPRARPWYQAATDSGQVKLSAPYVFASLKQPGITASRRLANGPGVFGADIALSALGRFIEELAVSPGGGVVLFDQSRRLLAMPRKFLAADAVPPAPLADITAVNSPQLRAMAPLLDGNGQTTASEMGAMLVRVIRWETPGAGTAIGIAAIAPMADFSGHIAHMRRQILLITLGILGLAVPVILILSNRMARTVTGLADDAMRIQQFDFSHQPPEDSHIFEFHHLSQAFGLMKGTIQARTAALEQAKAKLARLVELGIAVSAEQDGQAMMRTVLESAKDLANAKGAALYRLEVPNRLEPVMERSDDDRPLGGHTLLVDQSDDVLARVALSGTSLNDGSQSRLIVPLKQRGGDVAGVMQLDQHRDETGTAQPFPEELQRFIEALAAQAATAMHNHELLADARYRLERVQVQQELDAAARTQVALLPPPKQIAELGDSHGLAIQSRFQPSSAAGGDLWGCLSVDDQRAAFFAFDFTGHGLAAALNTFRLHALIHEHRALWGDPVAMLTRLDESLGRLLPMGQFATMVHAVYDRASQTLSWSGAGAPPPLLLRADGSLDYLDTQGVPLGLSKRRPAERELLSRQMGEGDVLMFHSDGLNEAQLPDGEMFGDEAVAALLKDAPRLEDGQTPDLEAMMAVFFEKVSKPLADDLTAVVVSRRTR